MAQAPIISPTPASTNQPWLAERPGLPEATTGNAFIAGNFVISSGSGAGSTLTVATSAGALVYGQAQRSAAASGATPEPYLSPTATTHTPVDVLGTQFWVNTATAAGAVGTGAATALVAGSRYNINPFTTSGYSGIQCLDAGSTAASGFFKYEGVVHPDDAAADTNARVLVTIAATRQ